MLKAQKVAKPHTITFGGIMLQAEGTGKTIEKAIENALLELKAPREDVDIKILNEGGLFKKAKVLVSISKDVEEKYQAKSKKKEKIEVKEEKQDVEISEKSQEKEIKKEIKTEEKKEKKEEKAEIKEEKKAEKAIKENKYVEPKEFLEGFFKALDKAVSIEVVEDEQSITYSVDGENMGEIIGRRGECFYAISTIMKTLTPKQEKRVLLDIANYKEKREESLSSTARRIANKVAKSGRYFKLEPMNASERRVIHTALQNDDRVTTLSKGSEPKRYVIIFPKEYKE